MLDRSVYRFVDTGNAPEFFTNGLHQMQVMGAVARFVFYSLRPTDGEMLAEPTLSFVAPLESVGPGIALILRTCPHIVIPVLGQTARALLLH